MKNNYITCHIVVKPILYCASRGIPHIHSQRFVTRAVQVLLDRSGSESEPFWTNCDENLCRTTQFCKIKVKFMPQLWPQKRTQNGSFIVCCVQQRTFFQSFLMSQTWNTKEKHTCFACLSCSYNLTHTTIHSELYWNLWQAADLIHSLMTDW